MDSARSLVVRSILLAAAVVACRPADSTRITAPEVVPIVSAPSAVVVPAKGTSATLDVGNWNLEWFGDTQKGPTNEPLQLQNARDVILGTDLDIWGVQEIVSQTQFNSLESQLPGYTGFISSEAVVTGGSGSYTATEQKLGILYRSSLATLVGAKVILTSNDYDFAGRPPLEVTLRVTLNGVTENVVFIVLHMKAFNDAASRTRRQNAANALKAYLDATYPTQKVAVIGDWNDDTDVSITPGQPTPFAQFVNDGARYTFPTKALSDAGKSSTTSYPDFVDHQLVTNEFAGIYSAGSAEAYRVDAFVPSYSTTTSDHYPVLSRYTWGSGGGGTPAITVTSPDGGESWAGGSVHPITWTSANIANVKLEYSLNGGTSWTVISSSTGAAAGSYSWTVPSSASTTALVRASDVATATSDVSNAPFTITVGGGGGTPANVILNEVLANEPGSSTAGEFIEIVNVGGTDAAIGGWTLSDNTAIRHRFPAGTMLAAGKAIVVFGKASGIPAGTPGAVAASTGGLSLGNGGETVTLKDGGGATKNAMTYTSSLANTDGVSANRNPDAAATGSWVKHTTLSALQRSAGKRANGSAF